MRTKDGKPRILGTLLAYGLVPVAVVFLITLADRELAFGILAVAVLLMVVITAASNRFPRLLRTAVVLSAMVRAWASSIAAGFFIALAVSGHRTWRYAVFGPFAALFAIFAGMMLWALIKARAKPAPGKPLPSN